MCAPLPVPACTEDPIRLPFFPGWDAEALYLGPHESLKMPPAGGQVEFWPMTSEESVEFLHLALLLRCEGVGR